MALTGVLVLTVAAIVAMSWVLPLVVWLPLSLLLSAAILKLIWVGLG